MIYVLIALAVYALISAYVGISAFYSQSGWIGFPMWFYVLVAFLWPVWLVAKVRRK